MRRLEYKIHVCFFRNSSQLPSLKRRTGHCDDDCVYLSAMLRSHIFLAMVCVGGTKIRSAGSGLNLILSTMKIKNGEHQKMVFQDTVYYCLSL